MQPPRDEARVVRAEGGDGAEGGAEGKDEAGAEFNSPAEGVFAHSQRYIHTQTQGYLVAVHLKYMHIHVLIRTLAPINFYAYILKWCRIQMPVNWLMSNWSWNGGTGSELGFSSGLGLQKTTEAEGIILWFQVCLKIPLYS